MARRPGINRKTIVLGIAGFVSVFGSSGCAHFVETRTIEKFMSALESGDLDHLRLQTSEQFEDRALRLDNSVSDLRRLKLPTGDVEIVAVDETSKNEKQVTVAVGPRGRRLKYRLKRDANSKKWVVDEIYMKQTQKGLTSVKSVTDQMDLLLSVREFVSVWEQGSRSEVLASATPEFAQTLGELPPAFLEKVTKQAVGKRIKSSQPKAQMDDDAAVVQLPRVGGQLVLAYRRLGRQWKVADVRVESRSEQEQIESVRELAKIISSTVSFLDAYSASDKQSLASLCSETFYHGSLAPSDLSRVRLPDSYLTREEYDVEIHGQRAYFKIRGDSEWVTIGLVQVKSEDDELPSVYHVEDVTIYDMQNGQQKKLSALFTAHSMMRIFSEALATHDLEKLRFCSTTDFNRRIWNNIDAMMLENLPLAEIERADPKVLTTVFQGTVTEVTVTQGARALTYVLVDRNGQLRVDDILLPVQDRPNSLKQTLEFVVPIAHFSRGILTDKIDVVRYASSNDFNRLVWRQLVSIPDATSAVPRFAALPIRAIRNSGISTVVELGGGRTLAKVTLIKEGQRFTVDDIEVATGQGSLKPTSLRSTLRRHLARVATVTTSRKQRPGEQRPIEERAANSQPQFSNNLTQ